ncbi:MAG: YbaB/EbfC family nucleoid-associated protein [Anaerolineales bacterium]|nr:YbaB/EbfC family nucleoid-associated protein [Anaerolineales bacterium]
MMSQFERLQEELSRAQAELAEETVEASAGGGAVRVVMSGTQECREVHVAHHLILERDVEMLQDLILLAVNQAIHDSQVLAARRLDPLTGGLGLPGMGV